MMKNNKYLKSVRDTCISKNQKIMSYLATDDSNSRQKIAHDKLLNCLKSLHKQADKYNQAWVCASLECFITDFQNNWNNNKALAWNVVDSQLAQFRNDINRKISK